MQSSYLLQKVHKNCKQEPKYQDVTDKVGFKRPTPAYSYLCSCALIPGQYERNKPRTYVRSKHCLQRGTTRAPNTSSLTDCPFSRAAFSLQNNI